MRPCIAQPYFNAKEWGGTRLRQYNKQIPSDHTGESWELSAHPNGESYLYGLPLTEAFHTYGKNLCGDLPVDAAFPLLIKLIDARETLSVQVHPDDAMAYRLYGEPYGKTEAWYILEARAGAELILGTTVSPEEMRRAIREDRWAECLQRLPVKPGDCIYIPAGTVHAIGDGILLYEIQQSSDQTFRLYAWGRDVPLHIEESLQAMAIPKAGEGLVAPKEIPGLSGQGRRLIDCPIFLLDELFADRPIHQETDGSRFYAYTALGDGVLVQDGFTLPYKKGDTLFVPAEASRFTLEGGRLLKASLPEGGGL